jgi:hypothetical protein
VYKNDTWIVFVGLILSIIIFIGFKLAQYFIDPLKKFEPVTDEELLLLTVVSEDQYKNLLSYIRTLNMSIELQNYLSNKKDALESISYFMMLKAARIEQEKKKRWESERVNEQIHTKTHIEKMITQGLNRLK